MKMPILTSSFSTSNEDNSAASLPEETIDWPRHSHRTSWPSREHTGESVHELTVDQGNKLLELARDERVEAIQKMKAAQRSLLPAVELREHSVPDEAARKSLSPIPDAAEIERPRSALHSGDFRESQASRSGFDNKNLLEPEHSSPPHTWYYQPFAFGQQQDHCSSSRRESPTRPRAPSVGSLVSSFVFRPPTSPLVQQSNNSEMDISENKFSGLGALLDKNTRRRTLPPGSFSSFESTSPSQSHTNSSRPVPHIRREHSLPYQAHQPRRSISSMHSHHIPSNSQTPLSRSRRQSFSSDVSPLHASMVGSYEESIFRGRMSTTPSKPLDFVAKIGVLGKGDCKPKLRFPSHVTVPFPAVFYSYPELTERRSVADDSPSPYVGSIDLEHNLKPSPRPRKTRKSPVRNEYDGDLDMQDILFPGNGPVGLERERRKRGKKARRSRSPQMPPGGCYRIPQEGQLQVAITNPNNTAVKLFLVPYSLEGMEPGTKTFIRQRSYSAGNVVEPSVGKRLSKDSSKTDNKPILRYLIHLMICCPSRGRFYLYDTIRVVFANRVPDGKEKLRNEAHFPDPKYSPYKPARDLLNSSSGAKLTADLARRRSSAHTISPYHNGHGDTLMAGPSNSPLAMPLSLPTGTENQNYDVVPLAWDAVATPPRPPAHFWTPSFSATPSAKTDHIVPSPTAPSTQVGFTRPPSPSELLLKDLGGETWQKRQSLGRASGRNTPESTPGGYGNGKSSLLGRQLRGLDIDADLTRDDWCKLGSQEMQ